MQRISHIRTNRGSAIIEVASIAFIITFMTIFALNIFVALLGVVANDQACRDASRAAARGKTAAEAYRLASTAVVAHTSINSWISQNPLTEADVTYDSFSGNINDIQSGTSIPCVTVKTTSRTKIPAPFLFFGALQGDYITAEASYSYPITSLTASIPGENP